MVDLSPHNLEFIIASYPIVFFFSFFARHFAQPTQSDMIIPGLLEICMYAVKELL